MPEHCAAFSCKNRRTIETRAQGITFHRFPKNPELRKKWEVALKREGFTSSDSSVICSNHFKPENFDRTGQTVRLRDEVIPSIFDFPVHLQRKEKGRITATSKKAEENYQDEPGPSALPKDDHCYVLPASPTALRKRLYEALERVESLERKKKNSMARENRAKNTMENLLEDLRKKNLINEELQERLEFYLELPLEFMGKQGHEYSKDFREFALTLHLHGPKAYNYLRETRKFPLPHPHTLQRWLCSVDDKPGLNRMMLGMLEKKCQEDPSKYGRVALMLDAMAIKKLVQYNPHTQRMSGYVDMGDGRSETEVASECLVFLVVGLQGHWKAPVAYYLTKSLSPETQKVLLCHALEGLHACGIKVVCVTMDGHASNVSMCQQLGCDLRGNLKEPLKTYFPHPVTGERVFVMMDACHMLKLARNMLEAYSPISSGTGQINWRYINHLHNVQRKDGLHAANKISDKHVHFANHKMKVSLAAQTLSRSVAVALRTMRDLGYPQFRDCEATAEFIELIDSLFDVMNGRNPRAKGFKAPLGALNWIERTAFLSRARERLITLLTKDGMPLHRSKRYLSVIGFVINIDTLIVMVPELLQVQRYVLTYRFSQDHLELLFNSIRASGGWNNNPSARQFQAIFRRLMVRCGVSPGENGNVSAQDGTVCLSAVEMSSCDAAEEHPSPFVNISAVVCDHSYLPTRFGGLVENALVYIAGFVVRQILPKLSCNVCRVSLVRDAEPAAFDESYHLLTLKNNGGLVIPSQGTVKVVRAAERVIRQHSCKQPPKVSAVTCIVREEIGAEDIFLLGEHIHDTQFGIDNHHSNIISLVVSVFVKMRLHHIAKLTSLELQKGSTRKKLCKSVLFQGF